MRCSQHLICTRSLLFAECDRRRLYCRPKLGSIDWLQDRSVGSGASGQELVGRPIEEQDCSRTIELIGRLTDRPDHGHPALRADLHVDEYDIDPGLFEPINDCPRVGQCLYLPGSGRQRGSDLVGDPGSVGNYKNGGHRLGTIAVEVDLTFGVVRRSLLLLMGLLFVLSACSSTSQTTVEGGIDVIDVSGPLDARALEFISESIELAADQHKDIVIVQINSKAVLDEEAGFDLAVVLGNPPLPVTVWVGPSPAAAYGLAVDFPKANAHSAIAPGSVLGHREPLILGTGDDETAEIIEAEDTGLDLQPTLRQYIQDLDGEIFIVDEQTVIVETLQPTADGGVTAKNTTFRKPGLMTRFLRLGVTPEAAFFFVTIGLTIAVFEFYALGPGVAAGVATLALIPGVWGLLALPTNWWAVLLLIAAFAILVTGHQRGGLFGLTVIGAVILQVSGMFLIDGGGQIDPRWWLVLLSVLTVLFFFLLAMPTVQRARLSSETVGRDNLIGQSGTALVDFDPDGFVEVSGARWRGTAHREAGISEGDTLTVTGVDGLFLEVEPESAERETSSSDS